MNADRLLNVVTAIAAVAAVGFLGALRFEGEANPNTRGAASAHRLTPTQEARLDALSSPAVGSKSAMRLRIVAFADVQCPFCAKLDIDVDSMIDAGAQLEYRMVHFPLTQHKFARLGARSLECARGQHRFSELRRVIYRHQSQLESISFDSLARLASVADAGSFHQCMRSDSTDSRIEASMALGRELGLRGTPLVIVDGFVLDRPPRAEEIAKMLAARLEGASPERVLGTGGYSAIRQD